MTQPDSLQVSDECRLTDDDLHDIRRDNSSRVGDAYATKMEVWRMAVELIELRALLATPMPCGLDEPTPYPEDDDLVAHVEFDFGGLSNVDPDESIGYGAALIRAGLSAKERK